MSKFSDYFAEPQRFTDATIVISGEIDRSQAALEISAELGEEVAPEELRADRVRFGFPPEYVDDREDLGACWYTGAGNGKGTKPVWVY